MCMCKLHFTYHCSKNKHHKQAGMLLGRHMFLEHCLRSSLTSYITLHTCYTSKQSLSSFNVMVTANYSGFQLSGPRGKSTSSVALVYVYTCTCICTRRKKIMHEHMHANCVTYCYIHVVYIHICIFTCVMALLTRIIQ